MVTIQGTSGNLQIRAERVSASDAWWAEASHSRLDFEVYSWGRTGEPCQPGRKKTRAAWGIREEQRSLKIRTHNGRNGWRAGWVR